MEKRISGAKDLQDSGGEGRERRDWSCCTRRSARASSSIKGLIPCSTPARFSIPAGLRQPRNQTRSGIKLEAEKDHKLNRQNQIDGGGAQRGKQQPFITIESERKNSASRALTVTGREFCNIDRFSAELFHHQTNRKNYGGRCFD